MRRSSNSGIALVSLLVLLVVIAGAWWFRGDLWRLLRPERAAVEVSEEAAELALAKLQRLRDEGEPAYLSSVEVTSLLQFRGPSWLLERVDRPSVEFASDTLRMTGTVSTAELPSHPELDRVRGLLPDSAQLAIIGFLRQLPSGRFAFEVEGVSYAGIPIPESYYPAVLQRFGRTSEPGLAASALALQLPEGVGNARVDGGQLILTP
jgi:hypothetical protein